MADSALTYLEADSEIFQGKLSIQFNDFSLILEISKAFQVSS